MTSCWGRLKRLNAYLWTTDWNTQPDAADVAGAESRPAGQTQTNRACFPDDARAQGKLPQIIIMNELSSNAFSIWVAS